jgi:ubiquinone/menaquinone biosynthesis C-methylase UbiE
MDYDTYFRNLANYYNDSRIPSKVMTGAAELRAEFNQPGSWVRECAESLQATLTKRRVLEIACGSGRWTQFVADVAAVVGELHGLSHVSDANWQRELKDRTSRRIYLRP